MPTTLPTLELHQWRDVLWFANMTDEFSGQCRRIIGQLAGAGELLANSGELLAMAREFIPKP